MVTTYDTVLPRRGFIMQLPLMGVLIYIYIYITPSRFIKNVSNIFISPNKFIIKYIFIDLSNKLILYYKYFLYIYLVDIGRVCDTL